MYANALVRVVFYSRAACEVGERFWSKRPGQVARDVKRAQAIAPCGNSERSGGMRREKKEVPTLGAVGPGAPIVCFCAGTSKLAVIVSRTTPFFCISDFCVRFGRKQAR